MPTKITQIEDRERNKTILRVEGSLTLEDAILLEKIAVDMSERLQRSITLDLADIDFLDSESAPILKRLSEEKGFELEGLEFFLQNAVAQAEKQDENNQI